MDRKRKEVNDGSVKDFARMSKIDGQRVRILKSNQLVRIKSRGVGQTLFAGVNKGKKHVSAKRMHGLSNFEYRTPAGLPNRSFERNEKNPIRFT